MSSNPFNSKNMLLAALGAMPGPSSAFGSLAPNATPPETPKALPTDNELMIANALLGNFGNSPSTAFGVALANSQFGSNLGAPFGVAPSLPAARPFNALEAAINPNTPRLGSIYRAPLPAATPAPKKLKAFFSFHYEDIMRVNVVRNAWKIDHPDSAEMRSFYDSSLWESRKASGDEALKKLIRAGVAYTSAVCVLIGSDTWSRRWVHYEIARTIIDGKGLLGVHLNSIRHHKTLTAHTRGANPLSFMGIAKIQNHPWYNAKYYLYELVAVSNGVAPNTWEWHPYADYTDAIDLPNWVTEPAVGYVTPLSDCAALYDYIAQDGSKNIGAWIDQAAKQAGR